MGGVVIDRSAPQLCLEQSSLWLTGLGDEVLQSSYSEVY